MTAQPRIRLGTTAVILAAILTTVLPAFAPAWLVVCALAGTVIGGVLIMPRLTAPLLLVGLTLQEAIARNLDPVAASLAQAVRTLDEIALVAAAIRLAFLFAVGDRKWLRLKDWVWPGVFVLAGVVSSLRHWTGAAPAGLGLALASKFFGFLILCHGIPWQRSDGERLVRVVRWSAPVLLVAGLGGLVFSEFTLRHFAATEGDVEYTRGGLQSLMVPFVNPRLYGWAMAIVALAAVVSMVERRSKASGVLFATALAGVLLSLRRRPLIGIPVAIAAAFLQVKSRQRRTVLLVAVLGAGALGWLGRDLIRVTIVDTLQNYLDPVARENTARGAMLGASVILARRDFPLGEGFGRFGGFAAERFYSGVYDELGLSQIYGLSPDSPYYLTDTYWPHLLGETGVVGVGAMLLMLVGLVLRMRTIHRDREASDDLRLAALFAGLVLTEGIIESLGGPVFEVSLQAFMIALPVGMATRLATFRTPVDEPAPEPAQSM